MNPPTLAGFLDFIRNSMGISALVLPDASPAIAVAFNVAIDIVNQTLNVVPDIYTLAVYNLGGSNIINFAPDIPSPPVYLNGMPFFAYMRSKFNTLGFVSGVVNSASDVSTSEGMVVSDFFQKLTMADLQYLKDPWGRQYLAFAQRYGTLWGLS